MKHKKSWSKKLVLVAMAVFLLGGCATLREERVTETEQLLAAAGFHQRPANTPGRLAHLQTLPPQKLFSKTRDDKVYFLYADPEFCHCLYVGDEPAYQEYQKLSVKKEIAEAQESAAMMNEDAAMQWEMWGPWPWW
jgi:hypothetical protein